MALQIEIFGIPVRIQAWFLMTGLIVWDGFGGARYGWGTLPIALLLVFQGVLFHELGHALVGRAFGKRPRIELALFAGLTRFEGSAPFTPGKGILVSLAGPLVGIVFGVAALPVALFMPPAAGTPAAWALQAYLFINLGWSLFNLLPVLPLDGGQVLANVLKLVSPRDGLRWARYASLVFVALLLAAALWAGWIFAAAFLVLFGFMNLQALRAERALQASGIGDARTPEELLAMGYAALQRGDAERVSQVGFLLLRLAEDTPARDEALHLLAWGRLLAGYPEQAEEALRRLSGERDPDPALAGAVLLALGRATAAVPLLAQALVQEPSEFVAKRFIEAVERAGAYDEAARLRADRPEVLGEESWNRLRDAALAAGAFEAALAMSELSFHRAADSASALAAARASSRLGRFDEALEWIDRARRAGFGDVRLLDSDEDLAPLRQAEGWARTRAAFDG